MTNIGFLNSMSMDAMIDPSISCTSPLIRAMMSPLRSSEKKLSGKLVILWYNWLRMSRTIPVRMGMMLADPKK